MLFSLSGFSCMACCLLRPYCVVPLRRAALPSGWLGPSWTAKVHSLSTSLYNRRHPQRARKPVDRAGVSDPARIAARTGPETRNPESAVPMSRDVLTHSRVLVVDDELATVKFLTR